MFVFVYGTLRDTDPDWELYDMAHIQAWDRDGRLVGTPGEWTLEDYGLYTMPNRAIPAVKATPGSKVVGDLVEVSCDGFEVLKQYEGYPRLYQYEPARATSTAGEICHCVVFTSHNAHQFGPLSATGDWTDPQPTEEVQCEIQVRVGS